MVDGLEEQGMEAVSQRHLGRKGTDLDLVEQLNIYEVPTCFLLIPTVKFQLARTDSGILATSF